MFEGVRPPYFQRSMSLPTSKSEFSDILANSYSSWIFSLLRYFEYVISPFDRKPMGCSLQDLGFTAISHGSVALRKPNQKELLYSI